MKRAGSCQMGNVRHYSCGVADTHGELHLPTSPLWGEVGEPRRLERAFYERASRVGGSRIAIPPGVGMLHNFGSPHKGEVGEPRCCPLRY